MGYYNNTEVNYVGVMPGRRGKGTVTVGTQKYEVLGKTMQKFENYFGEEAIERLESFAIDVLITHKVANDGYFRKI